MSIAIRKAVRVLLFNQKNELLLMYNESFPTKSKSGLAYNNFWCTIGGKIEPGESIKQALIREVYEETGLKEDQINIGPMVWVNKVEIVLRGIPTLLDETFIVVKTTNDQVVLDKLTDDEKSFVTKLRWFSFDDIKQCSETIFPTKLGHYLGDILTEVYPVELIDISK